MRVTIKIIQKKKEAELLPIYLYIYARGSKNLISTGFSCTAKDWDKDKMKFKKTVNGYTKKNRILRNTLNKAEDVVLDMRLRGEGWSFERFYKLYRDDIGNWVLEFIALKVQEFKEADKVGTSKSYHDLYNSVKKFSRKDFHFEVITVRWLELYVKYLERNNNTSGGVGVKLRTLRAVYNDAIKRGLVSKKYYPFDEFKVSKYKGEKQKKHLTRVELERLKDVVLPERLNIYRNYFLFQYYAWGVNVADMMLFEWQMIKNDTITFNRAKTGKEIIIVFSDGAKQMLQYFKMMPSNNDFIFPILNKTDLSASQKYNAKRRFARKYNKALKDIAKLANINESITSYYSRHTFATLMKNNNVNISAISEMMGHNDIKITQDVYLGLFPTEYFKLVNENL